MPEDPLFDTRLFVCVPKFGFSGAAVPKRAQRALFRVRLSEKKAVHNHSVKGWKGHEPGTNKNSDKKKKETQSCFKHEKSARYEGGAKKITLFLRTTTHVTSFAATRLYLVIRV